MYNKDCVVWVTAFVCTVQQRLCDVGHSIRVHCTTKTVWCGVGHSIRVHCLPAAIRPRIVHETDADAAPTTASTTEL